MNESVAYADTPRQDIYHHTVKKYLAAVTNILHLLAGQTHNSQSALMPESNINNKNIVTQITMATPTIELLE